MNIKASHGKVYAKFFGYGEQDVIMCENCRSKIASEIHHILFKSQRGKDVIENLIALCKRCHNRAHFLIDPYILAETLIEIHNKNIQFIKP